MTQTIDEYTIPIKDDSYLSRKFQEVMHLVLSRSEYTVSEVRSIWRRSTHDIDAFNTVCELLNTRQYDALAYMLDINLDILRREGRSTCATLLPRY